MEEFAAGILTVGAGRGFVVKHHNYLGYAEPIVITTAHCLPHLPPPHDHLLELPQAHPAAYSEEQTWRLLGPLGAEPTVWAECLFVDPIADIAVFGNAPSRTCWSAAGTEAETAFH